MGEQEEAVRRDPEVQQAWKIAEVARARLLECVDVGDAETLAEAQRMLDALRKATVLAADAEDRARVHLGLLTQAKRTAARTERHNRRPTGARRAPAQRTAARSARASRSCRSTRRSPHCSQWSRLRPRRSRPGP